MAPKKGDVAALGSDNAKNEKPAKEKRSRKSTDKDGPKKSKPKQDKSSNKDAVIAADPPGSGNHAANDPLGTNVMPSDNKKAAKKRSPPSILYTGGRTQPPPPLDPLLLARGLSSRYLSPKILHRFTPLGKEAIEKDLRHMDAYRHACNGYNQQLFVWKNHDLVRSGYFGTFAPLSGTDSDAIRQVSSSATAHMGPTRSHGAFSMPIKIDPEEEKRLSLLRKKIHQSEFERENLETEYLSLRAHYVHESQLARKTRSYELGRWQLLSDMIGRRAKVLGLMRAKIAIGRDLEQLSKFRNELVKKMKKSSGGAPESAATRSVGGAAGGTASVVAANAIDKNGSLERGGAKDAKKTEEKLPVFSSRKSVAATTTADLIEIWNDVGAQLKEAEMACIDLETPAVLSQMIASSSESPSTNNSNRSRSPTRSGGDKPGGRKRSSSVTSVEEASNTESSGNCRKSKSPIPSGLEPHVIPWDCMVEPRTPYDVPLLLSCLSSATDRAVGYITDKSKPAAITWLESTLPDSTAACEKDAEDLAKLREEARLLKEELEKENKRNTEIQMSLIASRSRSDEMVAMMQLLRSETEAVLERHNLIMETPEARAKSVELHNKLFEEETLKNPAAAEEAVELEEEEEEDDGEVDEMNEDLSSGEEEIQDIDDEEEDRSEDDESVTIKEITVDKDINAAGESDDEDVDDVGSEEEEEEEGEIAEDEVEEGEEGDEGDSSNGPALTNKRTGQGDDGDEESSNLIPLNSSGHRKRRRY